MTERTDDDGRWVADGGSWLLVEPSDAFLAARAALVEPEPAPDLAAEVAELRALVQTLLEGQ